MNIDPKIRATLLGERRARAVLATAILGQHSLALHMSLTLLAELIEEKAEAQGTALYER